MHYDGLRVNHLSLDRAADDLRNAVAKIDDRLDRLESELAPLRNDWSGQAQYAYLSAKATWDGALLDMRNLLDDTRRAVHQSNADYRASDRRGAGRFDR